MIKKISTRELRPGMTVARMQSDIWCHCPTLYTKEGLVETDEQVQAIVDEGFTEVFVDTEAAQKASSVEPLPMGKPRENVLFSEELIRARECYAAAVTVARELFMAAAKGRPMDISAAGGVVADMRDSLKKNPGPLGCLAQLAGADAYLYAHSVNVSVLSMLAGQGWGLPDDDVLQLGMAGLFHDLGKTRLPIGLLNRRVKLSADESKTMEGHCVHGLAILEAQRGVDRAVKRAVVEHHERFDGKGYPFRLDHSQISIFGRLLSLADCFDALVSKRTYKAAMPPNKALAIMYGMRDADFSAADVDHFIKIVGVYPSGSLVKLSTGELAVVCEVKPEAPLAPLVNVVLTPQLNPMTPVLRDLGKEVGANPCKVVECVDGHSLDVNPLQLMLG